MDNKILKLAIIIPAYNEEERIGYTLDKYGLYFNELKKRRVLDYEIIVVINNTKDQTEKVVKEKQKKNKNIVCLNFAKGGKGFAIIEGFKEALKRKNDFIGFVDADMATLPKPFSDLVFNIGNQDGLIASRYVYGAKVNPKQSLKRILVSRACNILVRTLFFMPYRDTQCGAKIFRRKVIERILPKLGVTHWGIDIDLLYQAKKNNFKISEFPTIWSDKSGSKIKLQKASFQVFSAIIQLRILNSPAKHFWKVIKPISGVLWRIVKDR